MLKSGGAVVRGVMLRTHRGQTLTEFALVAPLVFMLIFGIIVIGIAVFYQQEVTNAAREAARYAAVHTATSRCPTVSNRTPDVALLPLPNSYSPCDAPAARWPNMTGAARDQVFGMERANLNVTACWSGYWTKDTAGAWAAHDEVAINADGTHNEFRECTVPVYGWCPTQSGASTVHEINPRTLVDSSCPEAIPLAEKVVRIDCSRLFPLTAEANDMASSYAASDGRNANQVTVVTCYAWDPPLAGFLLIPSTHNIVGVITESLEYQQ